MGVHADELEALGGDRRRHGRVGETVGQAEPELAVLLAGLDVAVRAGPHARGQSHQHLLAHAPASRRGVELSDLLQRVEHEEADAVLKAGLDLGHRLVVAVEVDARRREGGEAGRSQLAARRHVEREPLLGDQLAHRAAAERLRRVDDLDLDAIGPRAERLEVGAALVAQRLLVVDEQRRAEAVGQLDDVAAADLEVAAGVVTGGVGIDEGVGHGR